jgi:hypothetical protein
VPKTPGFEVYRYSTQIHPKRPIPLSGDLR